MYLFIHPSNIEHLPCTRHYTRCWHPLISILHNVFNQPRFMKHPLHGTQGPGHGAGGKTCSINSPTSWSLQCVEETLPPQVFLHSARQLTNGWNTVKRCVFIHGKSRVKIPDFHLTDCLVLGDFLISLGSSVLQAVK